MVLLEPFSTHPWIHWGLMTWNILCYLRSKLWNLSILSSTFKFFAGETFCVCSKFDLWSAVKIDVVKRFFLKFNDRISERRRSIISLYQKNRQILWFLQILNRVFNFKDRSKSRSIYSILLVNRYFFAVLVITVARTAVQITKSWEICVQTLKLLQDCKLRYLQCFVFCFL